MNSYGARGSALISKCVCSPSGVSTTAEVFSCINMYVFDNRLRDAIFTKNQEQFLSTESKAFLKLLLHLSGGFAFPW